MELSAIWVVVIVLIGIAIGVYSICKGCQGLREQSAQAIAQLQERTATRGSSGQRNGANGNDGDLFRISGSRVYDKNPPNYDEIMEPPPSYEETIKLHGGDLTTTPSSTPTTLDETSAQVNLACTGCDDEFNGPSPSPSHSISLQPEQAPPPLYARPPSPPPTPSCSITIHSS